MPSAAVMPTYARQNIVFESGSGAWLTSTTGERFLDFGSGVAGKFLRLLAKGLERRMGGEISCSGHGASFQEPPVPAERSG